MCEIKETRTSPGTSQHVISANGTLGQQLSIYLQLSSMPRDFSTHQDEQGGQRLENRDKFGTLWLENPNTKGQSATTDCWDCQLSS